MQYFNFSRLINKYISDFTLITLSGEYIDDLGDIKAGEKKEISLKGAVISFKESKVYRAEGTLTAKDKRLFTLEPLEKALLGGKVIHEEKVYSIEDCTENAKFTGVYAYTLKFVSAFNEKGGGNND